MKIIRAIDCRTTRWKNGGGSTTEIAIEPPDASLECFDWRISMAQVASDGPFSEFPDIDRTLAVVNGSGLQLSIDGKPPVRLDRGSDPIQFPGDVATSARLLSGEISDLNVMTRRTRFGHRLLRIQEPVSSDFDGNDVAVVISPDSTTRVISRHTAITLNHGDAAILNRPDDTAFEITPPNPGGCYVVLLRERRNHQD
ncbi:MAG TPA: HutD family protein [Bradyrhizobium sp.]|nr:HutD family protein [Bradyrhizobium sp.]